MLQQVTRHSNIAIHSIRQSIDSKTLILVSFNREIVRKTYFLRNLKSWCPGWCVRDATLESSHNFFSRLLFGSCEWRWLPKEMSSQTDDFYTRNSFRDFNDTHVNEACPTSVPCCFQNGAARVFEGRYINQHVWCIYFAHSTSWLEMLTSLKLQHNCLVRL